MRVQQAPSIELIFVKFSNINAYFMQHILMLEIASEFQGTLRKTSLAFEER